jgi:hypothetical protein
LWQVFNAPALVADHLSNLANFWNDVRESLTLSKQRMMFSFFSASHYFCF